MIGEPPRGPFVLFGQHGQIGGRTKIYVFCGFEHHGNPQAGAREFVQGLGRTEGKMSSIWAAGHTPKVAEARHRECSVSEIPVGPVELVTCHLLLTPVSPRIKVIPRMRNLTQNPTGCSGLRRSARPCLQEVSSQGTRKTSSWHRLELDR